MPYRILIVDLNSNSGKTTLGLGLIYVFKNKGFRVCPFKPISIHNWFLDYTTTSENIKYGTIFCSDIMKLREVSQCYQKYEILNPVDILTAPLDPSWFIENNFSSMYYAYDRDLLKKTIMARISITQRTDIYSIGLVNQWLFEKPIAYIDKEIIQKLSSNYDQVIEIFDINNFEKVFSNYASKAIKESYSYLDNTKCDILVVESLRDFAWPLTDEEVDVVLGISPGIVLIYDAGRYKLALNIKGTFHYTLNSLRTRSIFEYLTPIKVFKIPPLPSIFVPEMLKEKIDVLADYIISELSIP